MTKTTTETTKTLNVRISMTFREMATAIIIIIIIRNFLWERARRPRPHGMAMDGKMSSLNQLSFVIRPVLCIALGVVVVVVDVVSANKINIGLCCVWCRHESGHGVETHRTRQNAKC